jgi:hypothetical protein
MDRRRSSNFFFLNKKLKHLPLLGWDNQGGYNVMCKVQIERLERIQAPSN